MKSKIIVLVLVLLVTSHSIPTVMGAPDGHSSPNSQNNSVLSNLKEAAEARQDELFYLFEEELPVEILTQLQDANELMNEASLLENSEKFLASQIYLDALKMFREAWEMYSEYNPEAGEESLVEDTGDYTPEPQPDYIEEKIKENKEKRIVKFQEKILKRIEDDDPQGDGSSVFDVIKSGLKHLNQMIRDGALSSAVDVLKLSMAQYENGIDEMDSKQSSKLDKTLTRIEDKIEREEDKVSRETGPPTFGPESDVKSNNGNGIDKSDEEPEEKTNNGNGNDMSDEDPEEKEKSNNGNGNPDDDEDDDEEPEGKDKKEKPSKNN